MKSLMNLKAFRTLNRYHISKIHENSSDWNLVTTVRARTVLVLENANKFLIKLAPKLILHFEALVLFQVTLDQRLLKLEQYSRGIFHRFWRSRVVQVSLQAWSWTTGHCFTTKVRKQQNAFLGRLSKEVGLKYFSEQWPASFLKDWDVSWDFPSQKKSFFGFFQLSCLENS